MRQTRTRRPETCAGSPYFHAAHAVFTLRADAHRAARRARSARGRAGRARAGHGWIVLLGGEAGVGQVAADRRAARPAPTRCSCAARRPGRRRALRPVVAALRAPALAPGRARGHAAHSRAPRADPARARGAGTAVRSRDAVRGRPLRARPRRGGTDALVVLDDLHWSDEATLELLCALAEPLGELSVLVVAAYRSDGLPRDHGLRRLRNELRRTAGSTRSSLRPLDAEETAELLAAALATPPSPPLAARSTTARRAFRSSWRSSPRALRVSGAVQPRAARA